MTTEYTYPLDFYRGHKFHLTVRLAPNANDVQDFAVMIHYTTDDGENIDVVRIDTSHDYTHMDQNYRNPPMKQALNVTWKQAEARLADNWRDYARRYDNAHGL